MSTRTTNRFLSSNCHAFFACLFDLYGRVEVEPDADGGIAHVLLSIEGVERSYLPQLQKLYGGTSSKGGWTVEDEQAEASPRQSSSSFRADGASLIFSSMRAGSLEPNR